MTRCSSQARAKREKLKQTEQVRQAKRQDHTGLLDWSLRCPVQATQQMTQNEVINKYKDLLHKHDKLQEAHDKMKVSDMET